MANLVMCAKLGRELPAIDDATAEGRQALKMAQLLGGPEFRDRVKAGISQEAWGLWKNHMMMVINEYRLDATSDDSNKVLREQMEAFFFGNAAAIPNYVPPKA